MRMTNKLKKDNKNIQTFKFHTTVATILTITKTMEKTRLYNLMKSQSDHARQSLHDYMKEYNLHASSPTFYEETIDEWENTVTTFWCYTDKSWLLIRVRRHQKFNPNLD